MILLVVIKLHHKITKAYLNRAVQKFTLIDVQQARKNFDAASSNKLKLRIKSVKDISCSSRIKLRYYRNNLSSIKLPVVVYFHGGGFALGSINSHDSVCRYIAKFASCVVLSVEYSLAPESAYPIPVEQGLEVLRWLEDNQLDDVDTSNIFLAGDSAGGNIALAMGISPELSSKLSGLVLIYPALDPRLATRSMEQYATGHFLTKQMLAEFWDLYLGNTDTYALPSTAELKLLPPVLVIAAEKDVLKDEGLELVYKLRTAGVKVDYECYSDMLHGFVQFPRIASKKKQAFQQIARFVSTHSI